MTSVEYCLQRIILGVHLFLFHLSLLLLQKLFEKVNIILGTITIVLNILTTTTIAFIILISITIIISKKCLRRRAAPQFAGISAHPAFSEAITVGIIIC